MQNDDYLFELYKDEFEEDILTSKQEDDSPCQCHASIINVNGTPTCSYCGICDLYKRQTIEVMGIMNPELANETQERKTFTKKIYVPYNRKPYFKRLFELLAGHVQSPQTKQYKKMIQLLSNNNNTFQNMRQLRELLRKNGHQKYYQYIYNIWYEIKGERIIHITNEQFHKIMEKFRIFQNWYKKTIKTRNMINYSVLLQELLLHNKIKNAHLLYLPKKTEPSRSIIKPYFSKLTTTSQGINETSSISN